MRKIRITLTETETRTLCCFLSEIRNMPARQAPGLEVEILLMHELHDRYMSALHFPTTDAVGRGRNKFSLPESQALATLKGLQGFDMKDYTVLENACRNTMIDVLTRKLGHLFHPAAIFQFISA